MSKPHIGSEWALSNARWCEPNAPKPRPLEEVGYYCGKRAPLVGDTVWLRVEQHDAMIEEPFWALYEHWTTMLNGMEDEPQDVDAIRLIHCETISPFENYTFWRKKPLEHPGMFRVCCLEMLTIEQIARQIPPNQERVVLNMESQWTRIHSIVRRPNFTIYIGSDQGASWHYIATNLEPRRLVLYQLSVLASDKWEVCNRPFELRGDEERIIKQMATGE